MAIQGHSPAIFRLSLIRNILRITVRFRVIFYSHVPRGLRMLQSGKAQNEVVQRFAVDRNMTPSLTSSHVTEIITVDNARDLPLFERPRMTST